MPIEINFNGCRVKDCGGLVSAPSNSDLKFNASGNEISGVGQLFNFFDPELVARLGLTGLAAPDELNAVIQKLRSIPDAPEAEKIEVVKNSRLKDFLAYGANISTLAKNVIEIALKMTGTT